MYKTIDKLTLYHLICRVMKNKCVIRFCYNDNLIALIDHADDMFTIKYKFKWHMFRYCYLNFKYGKNRETNIFIPIILKMLKTYDSNIKIYIHGYLDGVKNDIGEYILTTKIEGGLTI